MPVLSDIIEETRAHLFSREERNKLADGVSASATTIPVTYPVGQITRGSKISIELEDIYVWDTSGQNVTPVDRGQWGTIGVIHVAGTTIHVNPRFSNFDIYKAINAEISSLSAPANGLYRVQTVELTYNPVTTGYAYDETNLLSIMEVRYQDYGAGNEYQISRNWEFSSNLSDEFSTGAAIWVRDALPGKQVLVKGRFAFTQLAANLTADLSTTGLPSTAYDILSIGAAWRLTSPLEVSRNATSSQGDTRRASEVPPGASLGGARELGRLRDIRIREEASRLSELYPRKSDRYPWPIYA